jgi:hypothetical protein
MILQTDPRLLPEINKYGCYFMCICFFLNKFKKKLWDTDKINEFYKTMVHLGYIEADDNFDSVDPDDATIMYPAKIFESEGLNVKYFGHSHKSRICNTDEFEILKFTRITGGSHFVCGDGMGHVTYDPWGVSNTVKYGSLDSKRVFKMI